MNPLVTILIPARGMLQYFKQTIQSINKQSYKNLEIILIDDGIDIEGSLLSSLAATSDYPIRIVKNRGMGLVDALNTGLHEANGELVARIDTDDLMHEERISLQVQFMNRNPNVGVLGTQIQYISIAGEELGQSSYPIGIINNHSEFDRKCLIAHPSVMYRRELIAAEGGYRKVFEWNGRDFAEDFFLWIRLRNRTSFYILDMCLTQYRQHPDQISMDRTTFIDFSTRLVTLLSRSSKLANDLNPHGLKVSNRTNRSLFKTSFFKVGFLFATVLFLDSINIIRLESSQPEKNLQVIRLLKYLEGKFISLIP